MEKIKKIIDDSSKLSIEIEKKLYCIKAYDFEFDENFKKSFQFTFEVLKKNDKNEDIYILLDNKKFFIEEKSRIINFIIEGKQPIKRFIYSCKYLKEIFNSLEIQYYSLENNIPDKSLNSEVSDDEIYKLFNEENISTIYKIDSNNEKIIKIFMNRYPSEKIKIISDLSLNAEYYYPKNCKDLIDINIFSDYSKEIKEFIWSNNASTLYLFGPKGTSKSIFLMYCCYLYNNDNNPTLYINYNIMKNLEPKKRKNIFKKEIIYLFYEKNKFLDFYKSKYHHIIKDENNSFIKNLKLFIEQLINIYKNTFFQKIALVIDNFYENDKNLFNELEEIIKLVNTNPSKIKLIISGHSEFLNEKIKLFYQHKNLSDIIERQKLVIYDLKFDNENEIYSLPAFHFRKNKNENDLENILLKEEIDYCKKFNLLAMHYSVINNEKEIEFNEFLSYFNLLPNDYLTFIINRKSENLYTFKFKFHNILFLKAVIKSIRAEIKEKSLKFLFSFNTKAHIIKAFYEEKLLTVLISYNKLNLSNMSIPENNLLEVKEIYEFQNSTFNKINNIINIGFPIIISQENFLGKLYDLLVLIPKEEKGRYHYIIYMVLIGTNKNKAQIENIRTDFNHNKNKYQKGIKKFVDNNITISNIELIFIFDKDTQEDLFLKNGKTDEFGSKYCIQNYIKFYCFSLKDYKLYKNFDNRRYYEITEFGDFKKYGKQQWIHYQLSRFSFLNEKEIKFINKKIKDDITNIESIAVKNIIGIPKTLDKEIIYILMNDMNKYYIIRNEFYTFNDEDEFELINKKDINDKEKFSLFLLNNDKSYTFYDSLK